MSEQQKLAQVPDWSQKVKKLAYAMITGGMADTRINSPFQVHTAQEKLNQDKVRNWQETDSHCLENVMHQTKELKHTQDASTRLFTLMIYLAWVTTITQHKIICGPKGLRSIP